MISQRLQPPCSLARSGLRLLAATCVASLWGCGAPAGNYRTRPISPLMSVRMDLPTKLADVPAPATESLALAPQVATKPTPSPASTPIPTPSAPRVERFDLVVNSASTRSVFLALVADTRYSMLLHPDVTGTLSVTLKGVTLREALESIRDVYGYDFKVDGQRITIFPPTMQMRLFNVNYLNSQRHGQSDVHVTSGQAPNNPTSNTSTDSTHTGASGGGNRQESSQVSTTSTTDLWAEISATLKGMIGTVNGRSVVVSPQAGVIAVRAMPDELRQVDSFLRSTRFSVERQVMLEAKIIEVELRDGFQSGIDWSILGSKLAIGQASGFAGNPLVTNAKGLPTLGVNAGLALLADAVPLPVANSGILGLSLATKGFDAVLGFLETHGEVQVLSSPRVAAMNNQKALLKVGSDEFFLTGLQGGSVASGGSSNNNNGATTTLPTITLTPFFSGIALDVTPQIDDGGMITLHIHPSVTAVSTVTKQIDLGAVGSYKLPLAYSSVNETDTIVRIPDGNIVAIGGLMQMESNKSRSGLPGSGQNAVTSTLFGNRLESSRKKELVVLIKPTILQSTEDWQATALQARDALDRMDQMQEHRVIVVDGSTEPGPAHASESSPRPSSARPAAAITKPSASPQILDTLPQ